MIERALWLDRVRQSWSRRSVVWLSGVRRVGKTTLARMLSDEKVVHLNCDLPSVMRALEDPELFLAGQTPGTVLVFDEVHRLADPSRLLKIAADEYPQLRVLATGSSTLAPTSKFRTPLPGARKPFTSARFCGRSVPIHSVFRIWTAACCTADCPSRSWQSTRIPSSSANGLTASTRATSWICSPSAIARASWRSSGCCCARAAGNSTTASWRVSVN